MENGESRISFSCNLNIIIIYQKDAMLNLIEKYGDGLFACVMDSYDYADALERLLPVIKSVKLSKGGGFLVLRPDSGDPIETVLMALRYFSN
jgi:nicotinamide phosphoribosyltransferase